MKKPKPRTDALMARLAKILDRQRGLRASLARHLNPERPEDAATRLSEWLHRRQNPNGETVLALLEWMDGRR